MKQILFSLALVLSCGLAEATNASSAITKKNVLESIKSDPMGQAAFKLIKDNSECTTQITQYPYHSGDHFEVTLKCTQLANEYEGGGVYLEISIHGQYFEKHSAEVQKIEINRAG